VTKGIGKKFTKVEEAISQLFLLALFDDEFEEEDPQIALTSLPVKKSGLALPNLVASADLNCKASILATSHLMAAF
jgi:hypothetical protein